MAHLDGKTVIITGAGTGLGAAYARRCAAEGASIVLNDLGVNVSGTSRGSAGAFEVARLIKNDGGRAVVHMGDVSDPHTGTAMVDLALEAFGRVDGLVNNAGIVHDVAFESMDPDTFDRVVEIHLAGTMRVTQPVYAHMSRSGGGVIVNTTSRSGIRGKRHQANYAAAKAGIIGLSATLALEGAEHGIRVWTISPKAATRAWYEVAETSDGPMSAELADRFTFDAVTTTVVYMLSDAASAHTGRVVFASAESVQEVRWLGASAVNPEAQPFTVDSLAASIDGGGVLFPASAGPPWG